MALKDSSVLIIEGTEDIHTITAKILESDKLLTAAVIAGPNAEYNIKQSLRYTRDVNYEMDIVFAKRLLNIHQDIVIHKSKDKEFKNFYKRICKHLANYFPDQYKSIKEVKMENAKNFANLFINTPKEMSILFSKSSSRQSIHETIQYITLKTYLNNGIDIKNLGNKELYIVDTKLIKPGKDFKKKEGSKSIDFSIKKGDLSIYVCAKFINESGGSQDNQVKDAKTFKTSANNYIDNSSDNVENVYFYVLMDGEEGRKQLTELKEDDNNHVFGGTTEELISYLNGL